MKKVTVLMLATMAAMQCLCGTIPGVTYNIRREDNRFLWYYEVDNVFDSTTMRYTLGEVVLVSGQERTPIYIRLPYGDFSEGYLGHLYQGSKGQGPDSVLGAMICTRAFTVPRQGGTISAFRMIDLSSCFEWSDPPEGTPKEHDVCTTWNESRFLTGRGWCADTSEFVMSLVREADGVVLAVLDSIGVRTNTDSWIVPAYGTDPRSTSISVALPPSCYGERVYLRVTPKRYGPTPAGMTMRRIHSTFSRSVLYADQPERVEPGRLPRFLDTKFSEQLEEDRFAQLLQYHDRFYDSTGCAPYIFTSLGLDQQRYDRLRRMNESRGLTNFATQHCAAYLHADREWYMNTLDAVPRSERYPTACLERTGNREAPFTMKPDFERLTSGVITLSVQGSTKATLSAAVLDIAGHIILPSRPIGSVPIVDTAIDVRELHAGSYVLRLTDSQGFTSGHRFDIAK